MRKLWKGVYIGIIVVCIEEMICSKVNQAL